MAVLRKRSEKVELLSGVALFSGLHKKDLDEIAKHVDEVSVRAGEVVATEGERGQEMFVIVEGDAVVRRKGRRLTSLGPGDFFGEMSLLDGERRSATVTATTDCTLLVTHQREFHPLLDRVPGLSRRLLAGLSRRLREADRRLVH